MPPVVTPSVRPAAGHRPWRLAPWAERALVVVLALALVAPGVGTLARLDDELLRDAPATADAMAAGDGAAVLADLARRFNGRFAFRARLVRWQAAVRYAVLGVSPLPTVVRGEAGWWFYGDDGAREDAINAAPFTPDELEVWRTTLQHTADWLAAQGIAYVFVVAPDKHVIYPEYLPRSLHRAPGPSRADQLVAMLGAQSTVPVLDLRQPLLDAKADARVYHLTDTHWNDLGAVVAYRRIVERLRLVAPAVPPAWPDGAFRLERRHVPGLDLAEMMGLAGLIQETDLALVPVRPRRARVVEPDVPHPQYIGPRLVTTSGDPALPRALVYRDSFGSALVPFLAEHFQRAVFLWEYDVTPATVRAERPDVVIHEWVGRRLHNRLPYDAVAADPAAALAINSSPAARR